MRQEKAGAREASPQSRADGVINVKRKLDSMARICLKERKESMYPVRVSERLL